MSKKKVITVSGDSSKWYDKVIFVVKKEQISDNQPIDFVLEAENIISEYMLSSSMMIGKNHAKNMTNMKMMTKKTNNSIDTFLYSSIVICIFLLSILLVQSFM